MPKTNLSDGYFRHQCSDRASDGDVRRVASVDDLAVAIGAAGLNEFEPASFRS